jgi:hypothetical protein
VPKIESHLLAPESLVGNFSSEKIKIRENSIQARQKKCCAVCIYEEIIYNRYQCGTEGGKQRMEK